MLGELREVLGSLEFEDQGSVRIVGATWRGSECALTLDVAIGADEATRQAWEIVCSEERASRLDSSTAYDVVHTSEHVLLSPYSEPHATLAFRGRAADVNSLFAALWERHRAWSDDWFRFEHFLNPQLSLPELLATGGGILAEGPLGLLRTYVDALDAHGVESSIVGMRQPLSWLDGAWQPELPDWSALIIGQSYVIGRGFDVRRLPPGRPGAVDPPALPRRP